MPRFSVITCSHRDDRFARAQGAYRRAFQSTAYEMIRIPDAKSMTAGYLRGIAQANGDILLFSHDDVEFLCDNFPDRLLHHLDRFDIVGIAGTMRLIGSVWHAAGPPYIYGQVANEDPITNAITVNIFSAPSRSIGNMQALDGVFFAVHRRVLDKVSFDPAIPHFHLYDIDFTYRAYLTGLKLGVACDLDVLHRGKGNFESPQWKESAHVFLRKFPGAFPPPAPLLWEWHETVRVCSDRRHALEILHAPHLASAS